MAYVVAVTPLFIAASSLLNGGPENHPYRNIFVGMIFSPHGMYLSYATTELAIVAICVQARVILQARSSSASPGPQLSPSREQ
jgi:hypothetical protein